MKSVFITLAIALLANIENTHATQIEKAIPKNGSLKAGQVVYVENDGRCEKGLVLKVMGGNNGKGIKRQVECVERPE